jgi:hypothetical protein
MSRNFTGPVWLRAFPEAVQKLSEGKTVQIRGNVYSVCDRCKRVVRVDKPLIGSAHFCE